MSNADRIAARLRRIVVDAHALDLRLCVDAGDPPAIRVLTRIEAKQEDIRQAGIAVPVDDSCGGAYARVSGDACSYGNVR